MTCSISTLWESEFDGIGRDRPPPSLLANKALQEKDSKKSCISSVGKCSCSVIDVMCSVALCCVCSATHQFCWSVLNFGPKKLNLVYSFDIYIWSDGHHTCDKMVQRLLALPSKLCTRHSNLVFCMYVERTYDMMWCTVSDGDENKYFVNSRIYWFE